MVRIKKSESGLRIELDREHTEELEKTGSVIFENYIAIKKNDGYYVAKLIEFERMLLNHEDEE